MKITIETGKKSRHERRIELVLTQGAVRTAKLTRIMQRSVHRFVDSLDCNNGSSDRGSASGAQKAALSTAQSTVVITDLFH